jgi:FkbM family methyltransferase
MRPVANQETLRDRNSNSSWKINKQNKEFRLINRIQFIIAGLCYKLLQSIRRSQKARLSDLAVFADDDLGLRLSCFGEFETEILTYLRELFGSNLAKTHFIDVGANIGNHTIGLHNHFHHCHAFEPDPRTFRLLKANTANRPNIICHQIALSDKDGISAFNQHRTNTGKSHIIHPPQSQSPPARQSFIDVETSRLDNTSSASETVSFIKIDVEGHELQVLKGAQKLLTTQMPMILLELLATDIRGQRAASLDFLAEIGYTRFYSFQPSNMQIEAVEKLPSLRWINHIILGMDILIRGRQRVKLIKLDISYLKSKNYEAIFVRR